MPPKGSRPAAVRARKRRQTRLEREATHQLSQVDLNAEPRPSTASVSRAGEPRAQLGSVEPFRNYEPSVTFNTIKVTVVLVYGSSYQRLQNFEHIETTMGRASTEEQVEGLIKRDTKIRGKLEESYKIVLSADHKATHITYTDAAGYRHRTEFSTRWQSSFGIWAGEVEGGDLAAEGRCFCGACGGHHGPEIEVVLDEEKVKAALISA